jgi:hypothetical protein
MDETGTRSYVVARFGITSSAPSVGCTRVRRFVRLVSGVCDRASSLKNGLIL